jgi:hypothetical protein
VKRELGNPPRIIYPEVFANGRWTDLESRRQSPP